MQICDYSMTIYDEKTNKNFIFLYNLLTTAYSCHDLDLIGWECYGDGEEPAEDKTGYLAQRAVTLWEDVKDDHWADVAADHQYDY